MSGIKYSTENTRNIRVSAYVDRKTADILLKNAEKEKMSISEYVGRLICKEISDER